MSKPEPQKPAAEIDESGIWNPYGVEIEIVEDEEYDEDGHRVVAKVPGTKIRKVRYESGQELWRGHPSLRYGLNRPTKALRARAREGVQEGIEYVLQILRDKQGKYTPKEKMDALEKCIKIGIPAQSEVLEIRNDEILETVFTALGETIRELGLPQQLIEEFTSRLENHLESSA